LELESQIPVLTHLIIDIMAYNPTSSGFGYHTHNRQMMLIDFYTTEVSAAMVTGLQNTRFFHGLGMFFAWWYVSLYLNFF
jgi:hypothetical protein